MTPDGFLLLDHGWNFQPGRVSAMDPFGISEPGLVKMLTRVCGTVWQVADVIDGGKHKGRQIRTIVFRAHGA